MLRVYPTKRNNLIDDFNALTQKVPMYKYTKNATEEYPSSGTTHERELPTYIYQGAIQPPRLQECASK